MNKVLSCELRPESQQPESVQESCELRPENLHPQERSNDPCPSRMANINLFRMTSLQEYGGNFR